MRNAAIAVAAFRKLKLACLAGRNSGKDGLIMGASTLQLQGHSAEKSEFTDLPRQQLSEDDREYFLVQALGLPRRPQVIEKSEQGELLLHLLDLEKTLRKRPEFAAPVRKILHRIFGSPDRE